MEEELIGRTFGHCKIVSLLGKGGWGLYIKRVTPPSSAMLP